MLSFRHPQASTNTDMGLCSKTYAQNCCDTAIHAEMPLIMRYETHSARKSLIYKDSLNCSFSGHSKKTLDLQGLAASFGKLSTKLSTENLENFKTLSIQALRAQSANYLEDLSSIWSSGQIHGLSLKAVTSGPKQGENLTHYRHPGKNLLRQRGIKGAISGLGVSGLKGLA